MNSDEDFDSLEGKTSERKTRALVLKKIQLRLDLHFT